MPLMVASTGRRGANVMKRLSLLTILMVMRALTRVVPAVMSREEHYAYKTADEEKQTHADPNNEPDRCV